MRHDLNWRNMSAYDLDAVEAIAEVVHPAFFEAPEVLAERRQLYPNGAHMLVVSEPLAEARARILAKTGADVTSVRRL